MSTYDYTLNLSKLIHTRIGKNGCNNQSLFNFSKYGPLPKFGGQRIWSRGVLVLGILIYMWYFAKDGKQNINFAKQSELYSQRGQHVECSTEYLNDVKQYPGCVPNKCGRYVSDKIVTQQEAEILLKLAQRGKCKEFS